MPACRIVTSIIGTFFVRLGASKNIMGALYKGVIATVVLSLIGLWPLTDKMIGMDTALNSGGVDYSGMTLFWCGVVGLAVTGALIVITEYYTGTNFRPVQSIAKSSVTGHGTNVIQGLAISMESTAPVGAGDLRRHHRHLHAGGPVRHRHRGSAPCCRWRAWWWRWMRSVR